MQTWQIDRIKSRLYSYRTHRSRCGMIGTWEAIVENMILCPATAAEFLDDEPELRPGDKIDKHWPIKIEATRRFVEGVLRNGRRTFPTPRPAALNAYRDFLIFEGFLGPWELEPHAAPYHVACSLAQLFGKRCFSDPAAGFERFVGEFRCLQEDEGGVTETFLAIQMSPDRSYLTVRETCLEFRRRKVEPLAHLFARVDRCECDSLIVRDGSAVFSPAGGVIFGLCANYDHSVPGSVFLLQDVVFDGAVASQFRLVGDHHRDSGAALSHRRCTDRETTARMRRITAILQPPRQAAE